jgi:D-alanine-D-alanine ligase-like ATP-grasp enzyme
MADLDNIIEGIGFPMIVKPSISYASINISMKSVVHTPDDLLEQVNLSLSASKNGSKLSDQALTEHTEEQKEQDQRNAKVLKKEQKMEIDIETPTVFVERYLAGREFTALVIGDKDWGVRVYPVAERAFDPKLGKFERILAFEQ